VLGTVGLGVLALAINCAVQRQEAQLKALEVERLELERMGRFIDAALAAECWHSRKVRALLRQRYSLTRTSGAMERVLGRCAEGKSGKGCRGDEPRETSTSARREITRKPHGR